MSLFDILDKLEAVLPILGGLVGHPELGVLANRLINLAEEEIARRQAQSGKTRSEVLADAAETYAQAKAANNKLKALGHEQE